LAFVNAISMNIALHHCFVGDDLTGALHDL